MEKFHWQIATVKNIIYETSRVKTFTLSLPEWQKHLPGQHYDIRLTAEDGYQAERSYSVASSPEETGQIQLTVELIEDGEISSYLHEGISVGDPLEVRGPIGGHFVWGPKIVGLPLLLVAGGSGIAPMMAMLRHRQIIGAANPTALLFSVRSWQEAIYRDELEQLSKGGQAIHLDFTFTRQPSKGWTGYQRRIDKTMLADTLKYFETLPQCFVCGPSGLVEQVANKLVDLGIPDNIIRTERFGPA
jgi:ferredoxin-NADP reductase